MKNELKSCPCGKTPTAINIYGTDSKWKWVSGDCCGEWSIEFRTNYAKDGSSKLNNYAKEAWNDAPRPDGNVEELVGACKSLIKILPELWGDKVVHGDINLNVHAWIIDDIEHALSKFRRTQNE